MITIFVGDTTEDLFLAASEYDANTSIITYKTPLPLTDGTYHLSLGDLLRKDDGSSTPSFIKFLEQADTLVYTPPTKWSDTDKKNYSYMKDWTEFYLSYFKKRKNVLGLPNLTPPNRAIMLDLLDGRKTESPQLWMVGCSLTNGDGVNTNERYGELIAKELNMECSWLTTWGASMGFCADQILRSDVRAGDIVIWGLTEMNRFTYYPDNAEKLEQVHGHWYYEKHPKFKKIIPPERLLDQNLIYHSMISIHQVINFCKKLNVKLVLAGTCITNDKINYLSNIPNYIHLKNAFNTNRWDPFLDTGTDNTHPGPLTHRWFADEILTFLNQI
jgi:hypothetical protein